MKIISDSTRIFFNSQEEGHVNGDIRNGGWNSSLPFSNFVWHSLSFTFHVSVHTEHVNTWWGVSSFPYGFLPYFLRYSTSFNEKLANQLGWPISEVPASVHLDPTNWVTGCRVTAGFWHRHYGLRSPCGQSTLLSRKWHPHPLVTFKKYIRYFHYKGKNEIKI